MKYAAIVNNDVWGIGDTKEEAIQDARQSWRQFDSSDRYPPFAIHPASAQLCDYVAHWGGEAPPYVIDTHGVVRLEAEL